MKWMFSKICVVRIEGGFIACVKDLRLPYWVGPTAPRIFTHLHRFNLIRRHQNWMKNPIKMYPKTTMARLPKHYTYFHFWILCTRLSPTIGDTTNADQSVQVPCRVSCGHQCGPLCRSLWSHVWSHCGSPDVSNPKVHALFRKVFTYYVYNVCVNVDLYQFCIVCLLNSHKETKHFIQCHSLNFEWSILLQLNRPFAQTWLLDTLLPMDNGDTHPPTSHLLTKPP